MAEAQSILIVEDDEPTVELLSMSLKAEGYRVTCARDGREALEILAERRPDLVLLDLMLPRVDGITVCSRLREYSKVPIIVLSAVGLENRKVEALDLGANDYMTKPFGMQELKARVRAALREGGKDGQGLDETRFQAGNLTVDFPKHRVWIGSKEIHLTRIEYGLLRQLAQHANAVVAHDRLLDRVWGRGYAGNTHYLHIYVGRLRHKLAGMKGAMIATHPGIGYALSTSPRLPQPASSELVRSESL